MTEEKLDKLFHALRNEAPETSPLEVETWLNQSGVIQVDRSLIYRRIFFSVLIGAVITAGFYMFGGKVQPEKEQVITHTDVEKKAEEVTGEDEPQDEPSITINDRKITLHDPYPINDGLIEHTPIYPGQEISFPILRPRNVQPIPHGSKEQPGTVSGKQQLRDVLIILDSIQTYRKSPRFVMDESDCYVQIYGDYAVISYRVRNTNYYWGGRIHNEEVVEIDGKIFNVFAFQSDNNAAVTNFGGRVFFGYRKDTSNDRVEVIKFSQPWAPDKVFSSHMASQKEREHLVERSNSQKNF